MADLADVAYWSAHHASTGELISNTIAHKIADYWQIRLDDDNLTDDLAAALGMARAQQWPTIVELYALKDWALNRT